MIVGIDPKVDYAFKHLFGRDSRRPIQIDLVNRVLDCEPSHRMRCEPDKLLERIKAEREATSSRVAAVRKPRRG